jgi:hypothetical protein
VVANGLKWHEEGMQIRTCSEAQSIANIVDGLPNSNPNHIKI